MSNRHRLPYAALGGYLAVFLGANLALAQGNAPANIPKLPTTIEKGQGVAVKAVPPESKAAEKPSGQKTPAAKPTPTAPVKNKRPTKPSCDARCQAAEQREKHDLEAQQSMAKAAYDLVFLTWWQFGVGVVGITLLLFTLHLTRQANKAATRAAKAAEAAVKITSDTAEHQLRAYVHPSGPKLTMHEDGKFSIFLRFKNFGQTPAYDVIARMALTATPIPLRGEFPPPSDYPEKQPEEVSQGVMGPTQDVTAHVDTLFFLSPEYQNDIASGKAAIFLYGEVKYRDAFEEPRVTSYRLLYTGPWGGEGSFKICPEGNDAT